MTACEDSEQTDDVICFKTTRDLFEVARGILRKHGCVIEDGQDCCIITLPPGSTKIELVNPPRTVDIRYKIRLPDGYELREFYNRCTRKSVLGFCCETQEEREAFERERNADK
jgi:hypothetical protein